MDGRERAQRAVDFEGPDRVPIMHSILAGAFHKYGDALKKLVEEDYPPDFLRVDYRKDWAKGRALGPAESYTDEWGCLWTGLSNDYIGQVTEHPLGDWAALSGYKFPDPEEVGDWEGAKRAAAAGQGKIYVIGKGGEYFERMQWLRGFEELMFDFAEGRKELEFLSEKIIEHNLKVIELWQGCGADLDAVQFGDDWGSQMALMMRPQLWREFFKPNYKRIFDLTHEFGWRVHFHSDGNVSEIVSDLVEIGVDVLNIQLPVMDLRQLSRELKGKVCVRGGLDRQKILPRGTAEEVKSHVREVHGAFGSNEGGWIGNGEIGPDVPLENARAMYEQIVSLA